MDVVGSRLGRASSRYGPTPVFTGPVRRWKKRWVNHITTTATFNSGNNNAAKAVRLPRWTPVSSSDAVISEEPPRRKLRYTPIVVLEEKKRNKAKGVDIESRASKTNQLITRETTERYDVDNAENTATSDMKGAAALKPLNRGRMNLDLDLSLNGNDIDTDSGGENS